jgi:hypothetical protein
MKNLIRNIESCNIIPACMITKIISTNINDITTSLFANTVRRNIETNIWNNVFNKVWNTRKSFNYPILQQYKDNL